jgi:hypothetical protein
LFRIFPGTFAGSAKKLGKIALTKRIFLFCLQKFWLRASEKKLKNYNANLPHYEASLHFFI